MSFDKVNPKFHPNGEPKPFYGSTIISFVQPDSPFWHALDKIQNELKNLDTSKKMVFAPPDSFHMTIIGLDHFRTWNKNKIEASDQHYISALKKVDFFKSVQVKAKPTIAVSKMGFAIRLEVVPVSVKDQSMIIQLQNDAMKAAGRKLTTHHMHITLANKIEELTANDLLQINLLDEKISKIFGENDTWNSTQPILTFYKDMNAFHTEENRDKVRNPDLFQWK